MPLPSLPVADRDRARDSSVGALGLELVADTEMAPGMRWVQVRPLGALTSISLVTWYPTGSAGSARGTVPETNDLVGDLVGDVVRRRRLGVEIEGDVRQAPWGRYEAFPDPDGNGPVLPETAGD